MERGEGVSTEINTGSEGRVEVVEQKYSKSLLYQA
jgi:hypothetical protein